MQVWAGRPGNEGGVGGAGPNKMKMQSSPCNVTNYMESHNAILHYY
jgi:hypothetical protein